MGKWILIVCVVIIFIAVIAVFIGQSRERNKLQTLEETLIQRLSGVDTGTVDFTSISNLPPPVIRYFKHVLAENQKLISITRMHQTGELRTNTTTDVWTSFTADQLIVPPARGFIWNAKVNTPLTTYIRVLDSYIAGNGAGRVSILSAFAIASESGDSELNSGALLRYLAEAVWYPTALLPQSGVKWSPINSHSALATVVDRGTTVSLEFRINDIGEIIGIYSPGRFGLFNGEYKQVPWEGRFHEYQFRDGMRIPSYGEVGWYEDETLQLVWKGNIIDVQYQFTR